MQGAGSILDKKLSAKELDAVLDRGMEWAEERGLCWPEDRAMVEEGGRFKGARASAVSPRAKERGRTQCGSLGTKARALRCTSFLTVDVLVSIDARTESVGVGERRAQFGVWGEERSA